MSKVQWIKINIDILNDEKIKLIDAMPEADAIFRIWIGLLTLAAKTNEDGLIYLSEDMPYTDEMLSTILHRPLNIVRLALETLTQLKMITKENEIIHISNWHKHQNIDGLDKIREQNRIRQQKYRKNQKLLLLNKDIDKDIDIEENVTNNVIFECEYFSITKEMNNKYSSIYNFDLLKEYKKMEIWLDANPLRRKKNYNRFIANWLANTKGEKKQQPPEKIEVPPEVYKKLHELKEVTFE